MTHRMLFAALDLAADQELTEAEARRYFEEDNVAALEEVVVGKPTEAEVGRFRSLTGGDPQPGETLRDAIRRAWLNDIKEARKCVPHLGRSAVRRALT